MSSFYSKVDYAIRNNHPVHIEVLAKEFGVDEAEAKRYYTQKTAQTLSRDVISKRNNQVYMELDTEIVDKNPHLVVFRRGDNNEFYDYKDGVYVHVSKQDMVNVVDKAMYELSLFEERANRRKVTDTVARIASLLSMQGKVLDDEVVTKQEWRINLKNGLFDPKTKTLHPHTPEYFSTVRIPFDYDPNATAPKFMDFLKVISQSPDGTPDPTQTEMVRDMFSYSLLDGNPRHKVFYLYGSTARNGKSTTAKILMGLLGRGNCTTLSLAQLSNDNSRVISSLVGKQLNFSDEVSTKFIESAMLTTLSAEGIVEIDPKYKDPFIYQVKAKFLVACNDVPRFESSQGMLKRMVLIPFNYQLPEMERTERLDEILLAEEGPGILNWAIDGIDILRNKNFTFTPSKRAAEDAFNVQNESNSVYSFIHECIEVTGKDEDRMPLKSLYGSRATKERESKSTGYILFCEENGNYPVSYQKFAKEFSRFADENHSKITRVRMNFDSAYSGIRNRTEEDYNNIPF